MYIAVPSEILGIILPLLLGVAFLLLAERKVMAFVQRRKGPEVVGSFGLLQPLVDGLKLILKKPISPSNANFSLFRMAPVTTFMLRLGPLYLLIMDSLRAKNSSDAIDMRATIDEIVKDIALKFGSQVPKSKLYRSPKALIPS
ncbi:hypothetical protein ACH5RR_000820 [Cinchona calisaya]|uniref:NADH-ubiquinone oxidoreductase chain 1 n=1 Tax=Cinchona calisaya TaxID=153742 RepID=A0ABD3B2T1_9GENT